MAEFASLGQEPNAELGARLGGRGRLPLRRPRRPRLGGRAI